MTSLADQLTAEVRALQDLDLEGLRQAWRARFGPPPKLRSPELLRLLLAWHIQAGPLGGLDVQTRRAIRAADAPPSRKAIPREGTRITREWQGRPCEVEVKDGGFLFEGRRYRSLSQIAREITGVRWNGPRFFGLRNAMKAD